MRAIQIDRTEGPAASRLIDTDVPEPVGDELLIKVAAAGLNYADLMQTQGLYPGGPSAPYIAGLEAAGTVVAAGPESPVPVGTRVMGMGSGAFAEYVCWRTNQVFPTPDPWTDTQAAAFPVQWLTAHACLRTVGRVEAGDNVLIHAAAGGVGQAAVRLARHYGAFVIGTAGSPEKCARVLEAGAHAAIDYTTQDFVAEALKVTEGDGIDLLLEMVGGDTFRRNLTVMRPFGRVVVYGAATAEGANIHNIHLIFRPVEIIGYHLTVMMRKRPDLFARQWTEVVSLIAQGVIHPAEPEIVRLDAAPEALARMARRDTVGKVVLVP